MAGAVCFVGGCGGWRRAAVVSGCGANAVQKCRNGRCRNGAGGRRERVRMMVEIVGGDAPDMPEVGKNAKTADENEILLAELAFSDPSLLPKLVQDNIDKLDESFYKFVQEKIKGSADLEERETLRILLDAITDVIKQLARSIPPELVKGMTMEEIQAEQRSRVVQAYEEMYQGVVEAAEADGYDSAVAAMYDRIDKQFLDLVAEKVAAGVDSAQKVQDAITSSMTNRMQQASERLRVCLTAGSPDAMLDKLQELGLAGEVDDAFVLLLAGNLEMAQKAGNENATRVLQMLQGRAIELRDELVDPEVGLVRRLMRMEESSARKNALRTALQTKKKVMLTDGSQSRGASVDGKKLVEALRKLIEQFGNIDESFVQKLSTIGEEAEDVARELFNVEDKDARTIQDEAFHKRTVSVFDLERMEVEAEMTGGKAPWEDGQQEPPGFEDGKRLI